MGADYLSTPKQWDQLVALCRQKKVIGVDTEFYNVDPSKQSTVGRARIHVWSIAVRTGKLDHRGYTSCRGWMLPASALDYAPLREVLESEDIAKELHNQSVDDHSFKNHGITLRNARDTLNYVKWKIPELINLPGRFKLKNLMWVLLRKNPVCSFKELVSDVRTIQIPYEKFRTVKGCCTCGVEGCTKRKPTVAIGHGGIPKVTPHVRDKWKEPFIAYRSKQEKFKHPLESIVPGHVRWELLIKYAIEDAVCALQVAEIATEKPDPAPWPYEDNGAGPASPRRKKGLDTRGRPGYSQPVVDAVIAMEEVGFPRDLEFCTVSAKRAIDDEEKVLDWLHKWYVLNSRVMGPHGRVLRTKETKAGKTSVVSGTDGIWSSVKKKLKLFDWKGYPRSPVWQKGKVKPNKPKLDKAAMEWIKDNHPASALLIEKLLHLGRIRNGKKYLVKLRDAEDIVYPICGGAGDEDERSGAVTGRLGIKGELEAQQLPKPGDKDLYNVRRAIIA